MSERNICKGKLKDSDIDCGFPIMIIRSAPTVRDGKIIQIAVHGCMNPECSMNGIEIRRTETELETFGEV